MGLQVCVALPRGCFLEPHVCSTLSVLGPRPCLESESQDKHVTSQMNPEMAREKILHISVRGSKVLGDAET